MRTPIFNSKLSQAPDTVLVEAERIGFELDSVVINALDSLNCSIELEDGKPVLVGETRGAQRLQARVANMGMHNIFKRCPSSLSLVVIETFKLDDIFELDESIEEMRAKAA
ncbi:hypothetical protein [Vibrio owensii]|uniref:hypothetical protein n=1 Tax=Vibrio harveyi group TaxID=717610 RepID=UPI003CC644B7